MMFILCIIICVSTFIRCTSGRRGYCGGPSKCCRGYKWDDQTEKCIGCQYPHYGPLCQYVCNCTEESCDRFKGCRTTPGSTVSTVKTVLHTSVTHDNTTEEQGSTTRHGSENTTRQGSENTTRHGSENTTRPGSRGPRSSTNSTLIITLVSLSTLVFMLILVYVPIRVFDAVNKRHRGRMSGLENAPPNQYEEIELTGMTRTS